MRKLPLAIWAMVVGAFAMGADEFTGDSSGPRCFHALNVRFSTCLHLLSA
jgi:hypothetical protein